jgi:hypothetical protein
MIDPYWELWRSVPDAVKAWYWPHLVKSGEERQPQMEERVS